MTAVLFSRAFLHMKALFGPAHWDAGASEENPFGPLWDDLPESERPGVNSREWYLSDRISTGHLRMGEEQALRRGSPILVREFQLVAPNETQAVELATTFLKMLDWSVSRPIQLHLWEERQLLVIRLQSLQKQMAALDEQWVELESTLTAFKEYNVDLLLDFRTQQRLLQVDLAGVKARVDAINRLLGSDQRPPSQIEQLLGLKISAEVELAGLLAKKKELDELVSKTQKHQELAASKIALRSDRGISLARLKDGLKELERLDNALAGLVPLTLVDNEMIIQPVEWYR